MITQPDHSKYQRGAGLSNASTSVSSNYEGNPDILIDVRSSLLLFWRRRLTILAVLLIGFAATLLALVLIQPLYSAKVLILVEKGNASRAADDLKLMLNDNASYDGAFIMNEAEILRSRSIARQVIERLDLLSDPEFNNLMAAGSDQFGHAAMPQLNLHSYKSLNVYASNANPIPDTTVDHQLNELITAFLKNLEIRNILGSYAIQIEFSSISPSKAALIANTIAEVYIEDRLDNKFSANKKVSDWLDNRLRELGDQLRAAETAVAEYSALNNLTEGVQTLTSTEQLSQLNTRLIEAKAQQAAAKARLDQIKNLERSGDKIYTSHEVMNSAFIIQLKTDESNLIRMRSDLSKRYGEKHPKMVTVNAELAELRSKIDLETGNVVQSVANEVEVSAARVAALQNHFDQIKKIRDGQNHKMIRLSELEREAESSRIIFDNFLQTYKRSREQDKLQDANARILSPAAIPLSPAHPNRPLFLSLGLILSLFLGMLLALIMEKMDNKFRSSSQLERYCGYPCFALIPQVLNIPPPKLAQYVLDKPSSPVAEAMRTLRTVVNLRGQHNQQKPKVITVTSSFPGEGKTTLSTWMARLAAKSGDKVILIDADLRRPNVHRTLGQSHDLGIVDYLTGKARLKDVVHKDSATGLHVIFAKSVPNSALDLISSDAMAQLVEALRGEYDLVIIDTPACLAVSDARQLATYSDQLIYAVAWDRTPRENVAGGVKQFTDIGFDKIGFALTHVDIKRHIRYGYGDTVYYYGRYSEKAA